MATGMTKVQRVKIPVSDLGHSVAWYAKLLDLMPFCEFVEQVPCARPRCAARKPVVVFELRERQLCASPALAVAEACACELAAIAERGGARAADARREASIWTTHWPPPPAVAWLRVRCVKDRV
jgi:hypothetical protein